MYGLINKAIKEFITLHHGNEVWEETNRELGLSESQFISMESNPDEVTFRMLDHLSRKTGIPKTELAEQMGEYFLDFAGKEGFGDLLELAGDTLPELLQNLNELHVRVKMLMPDLNPPRFEISDQTENALMLHYYSSRDGFAVFMVGVLKGLFKKFNLKGDLNVLPPVSPGEKCIVALSWEQAK